ncbi:MAG: ABC transporter ATP-binding protein [Proteobacteria bacterium]|nr:ABC transporter ATP-binding protein [Pseudomonadota bacterium]
MSLLEMNAVFGGYGGVDILNGVDLRVDDGEIIVVIGANGAGKSTAMKAIVGLVQIREGSVTFDGADITRKRPDQVARLRLCYVPQERNVFPSLTVQENLDMGAYLRKDDYSAQIDAVYEIFPPLKEKRSQEAGTLSGGQRQMVAMGRALMLDPRLLLLDEPTAGLSPKFTEQIFDKIKEINAHGVGILMVEQNARDSLALADRGYVLAMGRNRFEDTGANLLANPEVAEMFLGG